MASCFTQIPSTISRITKQYLETLKTKCRTRQTRQPIEISAPFNFQEGPAVNFPGYSEDDISLMKEKAIASTAIVEDSDYDQPKRPHTSHGCGLGRTVAHHARKVSRTYLHSSSSFL